VVEVLLGVEVEHVVQVYELNFGELQLGVLHSQGDL